VFDGRVARFPFRDHQVPRLFVLHQFIECAVAWLSKDPQHVCALHCKAGKGRAGVMACCLLLRIGFKKTAQDMISHYDQTRVTMKKSGRQKGLTVPSQLRYVGYYERLLRQSENGTINPGKAVLRCQFVF
jgi:phosphatidylinositol-3,4,5-trisphosphate 3-phosphatase and dual-specificity protein phosphatase PTEN